MTDPGHRSRARVARGADRPVAELPPPPAGDPRRRRRGAGGPSARAGAGLVDAGLADDEAFLVAVKRMGDLDALSREFAREHSDRLWKQLVVSPSDAGDGPRAGATQGRPRGLLLRGGGGRRHQGAGPLRAGPGQDAGFYARNLSLFVLPLLTGYFVWKRRLDTRTVVWLAAAFVAAAVFANIYPFQPRARLGRHDPGNTEVLTALHLPDRALAGRGRRLRGWPVERGGRAAWTSSASRASCSSTTC